MSVPYLEIEQIRAHTDEARRLYQLARGKQEIYPLDGQDFCERVLSLSTHYDEEGVINRQHGDGIIGCLFPDGQPSPWGKDRLIVVNLTATDTFDPTTRNQTFTILHEGMGHYVLHFLKQVTEDRPQGALLCRDLDAPSSRKPRPEWQADRAAAELMMPVDKITWLLDGKQPPAIIDLDLYASHLLGYFGANRTMIETRLTSLGYRTINACHSWAEWRPENTNVTETTPH